MNRLSNPKFGVSVLTFVSVFTSVIGMQVGRERARHVEGSYWWPEAAQSQWGSLRFKMDRPIGSLERASRDREGCRWQRFLNYELQGFAFIR
eukprot:660812-Prorocentrum_minimum.AAC.1